MARVKTFTNGGSLLPGDLNSIEDDYEYAFSTYKDLLFAPPAQLSAGTTAGTYVFSGGAGAVAAVPVGATAGYVTYLDPADRTANTRTTKYRVRAVCLTDATAPGINFTVGLYPVATWGGASGAVATIATLGAVVAGSTVAFATPGASSQTQGNSGDFNAPAAGWYVPGVVLSGTSAAGAYVLVSATLQVRQV